MNPFTAWWYWSLFALCLLMFAAVYRQINLTFKHTQRRIRVIADRRERAAEDVYWSVLLPLEAAVAITITAERAVREHPDRVCALLMEGVSLADAIEAVA